MIEVLSASLGTACVWLRLSRFGGIEDEMALPKITGRNWRELPMIIILGLVIGLGFGHVLKLIPLEPMSVATRAKR
jgi:hypothetical protein